MNTTRREFLVALGAASTAAAAAVPAPNLKFPKNPRERIAVCSGPFKGADLKQFPAMVAEKFDVRAVELATSQFASDGPPYLGELRAAAERVRSRIVNLAVDEQLAFYHPDEAERAEAVKRGKAWVDAAAALEAPSVRLRLARVKDLEPEEQRAAEGLKQVAAYAASKKMVVNLENIDRESENAFFLLRVIQTADTPFLCALPDFGNSLWAEDEAYHYRALNGMFRSAYNMVHVKDSFPVNGKQVPVDLPKIFGIAKVNDYRGYYGMEFNGDGDAEQGTRALIEQTLKLI